MDILHKNGIYPRRVAPDWQRHCHRCQAFRPEFSLSMIMIAPLGPWKVYLCESCLIVLAETLTLEKLTNESRNQKRQTVD